MANQRLLGRRIMRQKSNPDAITCKMPSTFSSECLVQRNNKSSALRKAGLFYLVFVMFSYTTGGPFGLEDMVTTSGPGMTLIYLLVLPFFWCIPVSLVAAALEIFIFVPVMPMVVMGLFDWHHNPFSPLIPPHQPTFKIFGVGLALGLWLYSGYEQLSTVAEEVENPQRAYPLALALVVPLSIAAYFLPTLAGLASAGNWEQWHTGFFSDAAKMIGGPWLGTWMTRAAMVGNVALLNSTVLTTTRMPFAMAEDGYLPAALTRKHSRYGTPWLAIVVSAIIYALLAWQSLGQLISVYIWLRSATTVLTVLSAWKLRRTRPEMPRAFVIPGGHLGLIYVVAAPVVMALVALLGSDRFALIGGAIAIVLGPMVYGIIRLSSRQI